MTETIDTAQPEALRLLQWYDEGGFSQGTKAPSKWVLQAAAELRRLQNALEMAVNDAQRSWSELAAAEARNATLTDDAARYRWLRDQHEDEEEATCCVFAPNDMRECLVPVGDQPGELDSFIDAELARAAASISTKGEADA